MANPKRPRDPNQRAKLVVDIATGEEKEPPQSSAGQAGGLKGGPARAAKLSPAERVEIARKAARTRWAQREK